LQQKLDATGPLEVPEMLRLGAQIARGLAAAHARGLIHRDIKPGNILLAPNGTVKITDFGISRAKDDVTVTKTGMIAGTPAYLAPEVAIGGDPGPEADVFSLGSTLYAACEGQPPFGLSENTLSLLHAVAAGQINPPRQSGPMTSVLAVLLHPEVEHRPTAEECEELLSAVARGETPLGGPAGDTMMAPSSGTLGAAALGAAGGAAAAGLLHPDDQPPGHSGSLLNEPGVTQQYDPNAQQYYGEDPYPPGSGYPEDDYDDYGYQQDEQYHQEPPLYGDPSRNGLAATRAVPVPDGYEDDPYDDEPPYSRAQTAPEDDEPEKRGAWKKPAIIGGVVVVGLVALGVWLLTPGNPPDASPTAPPASSSEVAPTSVTVPSTDATTTVPTTSSQENQTRETASTRHSRRTTTAEDTPTKEPSRTRNSEPTQPSHTKQTQTSESQPPQSSGAGGNGG
jgi:serine/threonine protein kinase